MDWKETFEKSLDFTYQMVKRKISDIKYPCYGGEFYRGQLFRIRQQDLYFYLTAGGILFTPSGVTITEIPFSSIRKLSVKKGKIVNRYHIRFTADKKYHFYISCKEIISTELIGNVSENVKGFIDTLQSNVKSN